MTEQRATPGKTGPPNFMEVCDEVRGEWLSRAKSEADLAAALMEKVTTARSFPETTAAYGEWMRRWAELFAARSARSGGRRQVMSWILQIFGSCEPGDSYRQPSNPAAGVPFERTSCRVCPDPDSMKGLVARC